jgi:hypothetical protein
MSDLFLVGFEENWDYVNIIRRWQLDSPQIYSYISGLEILHFERNVSKSEKIDDVSVVGCQWNGNYEVYFFEGDENDGV